MRTRQTNEYLKYSNEERLQKTNSAKGNQIRVYETIKARLESNREQQ